VVAPARQGSWEAAAAFFEEAFVKPSRTCSLFTTTRFRSRFLPFEAFGEWDEALALKRPAHQLDHLLR
jgi:hypothetical protein